MSEFDSDLRCKADVKMQADTEPVVVINHNPRPYGWGSPGEFNELIRSGCNEGPWMTKYNNRYYLQSALPGQNIKHMRMEFIHSGFHQWDLSNTKHTVHFHTSQAVLLQDSRTQLPHSRINTEITGMLQPMFNFPSATFLKEDWGLFHGGFQQRWCSENLYCIW